MKLYKIDCIDTNTGFLQTKLHVAESKIIAINLCKTENKDICIDDSNDIEYEAEEIVSIDNYTICLKEEK